MKSKQVTEGEGHLAFYIDKSSLTIADFVLKGSEAEGALIILVH